MAWNDRARGLLVPVLVYGVVPAILLALTYSFLRFRAFMREDPEFCALCHLPRPEFKLWTQGEHRRVPCQKCHHQSDAEALRNLFVFAFGSMSTSEAGGDHVATVISSCVECHTRHDSQWGQIGASVGHSIHFAEKKIPCTTCHATGMHRFMVASETCGSCHSEKVVSASGMEKLHCLACHNFLSPGDEIRPSRRDCLSCHEARGIAAGLIPRADAPMQSLPCYACHRPHARGEAALVGCHECHQDAKTFGLHANENHTPCAACHKAHSFLPTRKRCTDCHDDKVSHFGHKACHECHDFRRSGGLPHGAGGAP